MRLAFLLLSACAGLTACERNVAPSRTPPAQHVEGGTGAPVLPAPEAVRTPAIARLDPETLTDADIAKVLPPGPGCRFAYTQFSPPVVVVRAGQPAKGVVKLHGALVEVRPRTGAADLGALATGPTLVADGLTLRIDPKEGEPVDPGMEVRHANLIFELKQGLRVGYSGFYGCVGQAREPAS